MVGSRHLEEGVHVGSKLGVVLEEKAVGRVRVDREPRVREEPGQQVRVAREDHGSLSPLATNTGSSIAATRWSSEWLGMPQAHTASYCAWRVCHAVGSSRSLVLPPKMRPAACWPASRLVSVGAKKTSRYPCRLVSG